MISSETTGNIVIANETTAHDLRACHNNVQQALVGTSPNRPLCSGFPGNRKVRDIEVILQDDIRENIPDKTMHSIREDTVPMPDPEPLSRSRLPVGYTSLKNRMSCM